MFQENKARQIFRKKNISYPLIRTRTDKFSRAQLLAGINFKKTNGIVSASVLMNFVPNKALLIRFLFIHRNIFRFCFSFAFVFGSHLRLKSLKTKSLNSKGARFSFNHYEGNVKNHTLLFFFCLFLFLLYIKAKRKSLMNFK